MTCGARLLPKSGAKPLAPTKPLAGQLARGFVVIGHALAEMRTRGNATSKRSTSAMPIQLVLNKSRVPVKVFTKDIEHDALQQLLNVAQLPIVFGHVAAMPDVHHGIGATVGSVIATQRAIIPAAVGVDIGCGMNAVRLD